MLKVVDDYNGLQAATTAIEGLFKTEQSSPLTPIIKALDVRRDCTLMGIFKMIEDNTFHFTPPVKEAAVTVTKYIVIYSVAGAVAGLNIQAETATVACIVTEIQTRTDLLAATTSPGLTSWVAEFKTSNTLLDEIFNAQLN